MILDYGLRHLALALGFVVSTLGFREAVLGVGSGNPRFLYGSGFVSVWFGTQGLFEST